MKTTIYISLIILLFSCITPKNYEGYIFTKQKKPVMNIRVCEENSTNCTFTNKEGFFRLKKNTNSINNLIIFSNNKSIDSITTVWTQHGERVNYSFIEGRKDTLFLKN